MKKKQEPKAPGTAAMGVLRVRLTRSTGWEDTHDRLFFLPKDTKGVVLRMIRADSALVCWDFVVCNDRVYRNHPVETHISHLEFVGFDSVFPKESLAPRAAVREEEEEEDEDIPF